MELGTGVFLSALFLGTIALFVATKDRWNWKKILLWPIGLIFSISLISIGAYFLYQKYEKWPRTATGLWEVYLYQKKTDVKFKKGNPQNINDNLWTYEIDKYGNYCYVLFGEDGEMKDKVLRIFFYGDSFYKISNPFLEDVLKSSSYKDLEDKIGKPSSMSISEDELSRTYCYDNYNIAVEFQQDNLKGIGIYIPKYGAIGYARESNATS